MKVALGVTGGISAYKAVEVMRGLQKRGVAVQVLMTQNATRMIAPLTFQAISGLPVITDMWAPTDDSEIKHIQIAQGVDLLIVAPATANILAKFANGLADDFLSTVYISATAPVLVAPAMNVEMWAHPATQENVRRLRHRGVHFVDPEAGFLACKSVGAGRLAEPETIVNRAWEILQSGVSSPLSGVADSGTKPLLDGDSSIRIGFLKSNPGRKADDVAAPTPDAGPQTTNAGRPKDLSGETILITAGPTYEALDPVRGITNRSSGKMGYALAAAALARGAEVVLISGPVALTAPAGAKLLAVKSAAQMYDAVMENLAASSIVIMAAAVADYRPVHIADQKIKKRNGNLVMELERTTDILAAVGKVKEHRLLIGFAAETQEVEANAEKKLTEKNADMMVANDVSAADAGFDVETNRVSLIARVWRKDIPLLTKREVAEQIFDAALELKSQVLAPV
ncbi:MAG: bifunctional phosphopantothenoylcysteine decarboxylase/phosphopantothenate--cysteine ligase CoaBC [Acidobacteria bacterium]|nr:bifunctional phosphopantothenoylcysteine decarboxylase/phosphopantothenate--cysteine ligase CoaBC [Acidobacteriota bacterium]